jgi:phosphoglycolate phosphatase
MPNPSLRPRQFDLIAFDWDGTLFDSTAIITRCIQRAVVDVGGQEPSKEAASYVIGLGLMQALAHAAPDVPVEKYPELGPKRHCSF